MQTFKTHTGKAVALLQSNIDTDQILPKQFLKRTEKSGYGEFLFYDWRYDADGNLNENFILNQPCFRTASVLLAGANFGSGSSREHAPWALRDFGFRVIVAASFADIFYNNCFKIGMLPVVLSEEIVAELARRAESSGDYLITADLEKLEISDNKTFRASFQVDDFRRELLLKGLDEIDLTLRFEDEISRYEESRESWLVSIK